MRDHYTQGCNLPDYSPVRPLPPHQGECLLDSTTRHTLISTLSLSANLPRVADETTLVVRSLRSSLHPLDHLCAQLHSHSQPQYSPSPPGLPFPAPGACACPPRTASSPRTSRRHLSHAARLAGGAVSGEKAEKVYSSTASVNRGNPALTLVSHRRSLPHQSNPPNSDAPRSPLSRRPRRHQRSKPCSLCSDSLSPSDLPHPSRDCTHPRSPGSGSPRRRPIERSPRHGWRSSTPRDRRPMPVTFRRRASPKTRGDGSSLHPHPLRPPQKPPPHPPPRSKSPQRPTPPLRLSRPCPHPPKQPASRAAASPR